MMREDSFPPGGFDPGLADGKSAASTWRHHGLVTWVSQDGEMVDMKWIEMMSLLVLVAMIMSCLRFEMGFSRSNMSFFWEVSILYRSFWEIY